LTRTESHGPKKRTGRRRLEVGARDLSRMLEKYDIEVDTAESAEQAIEYLTTIGPTRFS